MHNPLINTRFLLQTMPSGGAGVAEVGPLPLPCVCVMGCWILFSTNDVLTTRWRLFCRRDPGILGLSDYEYVAGAPGGEKMVCILNVLASMPAEWICIHVNSADGYDLTGCEWIMDLVLRRDVIHVVSKFIGQLIAINSYVAWDPCKLG
ncbi:hypothetical protein OUZ56_003643 [Daphnia magna]|uniref:Uncharacterized protein n=1 Tax=Daphnia magna TaxID=35525 RepID=A0ABR0A9K1_9CRUS|nr:hypothetical protein OUZ56_003643 [Daphnia magna]